MIIHLYGVAAHIISIVSIYKPKAKYFCDEEEGLNYRINNILNERFSNNKGFVLAMCIMSIITIIINLIFIICLKCNKNEINNEVLPNSPIPIPMMYGMQQPVYIQQSQAINPVYGNPNPVYYNPQQINSQINSPQIQIIGNANYTNYNASPPSSTPIEKY